jgi:hypothetical protein
MKKLLVVFVLLWATAASATLAYVNGGSATAQGSSGAVSLTYTCTVGDVLFLVGGWNTNGSATALRPRVTDTLHQFWIRVGGGPALSGHGDMSYAYYLPSCLGSSNTITLAEQGNGGSVTNTTVAIVEYSGWSLTYYPLMESSFNSSPSTQPLATGNVTPANTAGLLLFGYDANNKTGTISSSGFTSRINVSNSGNGNMTLLDRLNVSAGTYNPSVADTTTPSSFFVGVISIETVQQSYPTLGFTQETANYYASATSAAIIPSFPYNAGGTLLATVTNRSGNVFPTSVSDGVNSWNLVGYSRGATTAFMCVYVATNVSTGRPALTVSFAGAQEMTLTVVDYTGLTPIYSVEIHQETGAAGTSVAALVTTGTNDIIFSAVNDENAGGDTFSASAGYTQRAYVTSSNVTTATFDAAAATPGTYSNTVTGGSGNTTQIIVALRPTLPSLGRLQYTLFTTATSKAYGLNNLAGSLLLAMCRATGTMVIPTDTAGDSFIALPSRMSSDSTSFYTLSYAANAVGGANTASCGASGTGIALWEYVGLDTVSPLANSSEFFSDSASSTVNAGPVTIYSPGILFSVAGALAASGVTFTGGTGFVPVLYFDSIDSVQQWDETVTAGSYSNSVTASGSMSYANAFTVALSSVRVTYPVLRQFNGGSGGSGGDGSISAVMLSHVVAGDLGLFLVANQAGSSPGTLSDTQHNTYSLIKGGGSNPYGLWWTTISASGALTVTNTNANCVSFMEFSGVSSPIIDQSNSGTSSTASVNTGSITTTQANELVVAAGWGISDVYRLLYTSQSAGWSGLTYSCGGHYAAAWVGYRTQAPVDTYFDIFTWAHSMTDNAAIVGFIGSPATGTTQPSVIIITDLRGVN